MMQKTLLIKLFRDHRFSRLILVAAYFMVLVACTTSKKLDEGNGITLKRWHWNISFHELGRDFTILYYKGKKICPNIDFYILSPNKKFILYSHEIQYNSDRLEVYEISKEKKRIFEHLDPLPYQPEKSDIKWNDVKIELFDGEIILYLTDEILEMQNLKWDKEYLRYLFFQIDQLYKKIESKDRRDIENLCKPYFGKRLSNMYYSTEKKIPIEIWQKLGETMYSIIGILKDKYKDKLVFQVFERAFQEHFKIEQGKVKFVWEELEPKQRIRINHPDITIKDIRKKKE